MKALILGAGGFIGNALADCLRTEGAYVVGVDIKNPAFNYTPCNEFILHDLRDGLPSYLVNGVDEIYHFAADMGGAGYLFTGEHDADVMRNNMQISTNVLSACLGFGGRILYASSACVYPEHNQLDPANPYCQEDSVYPAECDSDYGWEKLFGERLFLAHQRNYGLNIRIARFHAIYGPGSEFEGERAKAPMALCRKVATTAYGVEVWGDGKQTRSFCFINDAIKGVRRLMNAPSGTIVNIGSEELVSINELAGEIIEISGRDLVICNMEGPQGVRGRCSHNARARKVLDWEPKIRLAEGLEITYRWVKSQLERKAA